MAGGKDMAMTRFDFGARAFGIGFVVALLAGCGAQNAMTGAVPQGVTPMQTRAHQASGSSGDLLYIIGGSPSNTLITILTYPQYQPFGTIKIFGPDAVCADMSGNVWVTTGYRYLYKYAHGQSKRIAKLDIGNSNAPLLGCSVDPTTGNLAVVVPHSGVAIFSNARGKPTFFNVPINGYQCAYDDKGNLFVDGIQYFGVAELPKGSSQGKTITLDKTGQLGAGGIQWDGKYMAISTRLQHHQHVILRFHVLGSQGKVVQTIHFKDQWLAWPFWIQGGNMIAPTPRSGDVAVWPYPGGGKPTAKLNVFGGGGITVSVAPPGSRIRK
jgi:hypothetical protein